MLRARKGWPVRVTPRIKDREQPTVQPHLFFAVVTAKLQAAVVEQNPKT